MTERAVRDRVEELSDTALYREAERFFLQRQYPMTNAQMSGLWSVCNGAASVEEIKRFVNHQGEKAKNKGRLGEHTFWLDLRKRIEGLEAQAKGFVPNDNREQVKDVSYHLVREFLQHLVAHNRYLIGGGR